MKPCSQRGVVAFNGIWHWHGHLREQARESDLVSILMYDCMLALLRLEASVVSQGWPGLHRVAVCSILMAAFVVSGMLSRGKDVPPDLTTDTFCMLVNSLGIVRLDGS
jgi:hypothetical protein